MTTPERPIPEIVHRYEDPYKHAGSLKAFVGNERVGYMEYSRNYETSGWNLDFVIVNDNIQGKGVGKALIRSFVDQVGSGQKVSATIIHEATYQTLVDRYGIGSPGDTTEVPEEDYPSLALVRGLKMCGIEVTKISVGLNLPEIEDINCNVALEGRTL
ncbi:MAG: GNAT family N-acetyltransferase [Candidatus Levybacteria bacterium]|nr:GNAT family N-acetyltransferase [Candidatus Levybacteria bacterium]